MQSTTADPAPLRDASAPQRRLPFDPPHPRPRPFFAMARDSPIGPGIARRAVYMVLASFCTPPRSPGSPGITPRLTRSALRTAAGNPDPKTLDRHLAALSADGWIAWHRTGRGSVFYVHAASPRRDTPLTGGSDSPTSGESDPPASGESVREQMSSERSTAPPTPPPDDIGGFRRAVESLITRAQAGCITRITGEDFRTVSQWNADGIGLDRIAAEVERTVERQRAAGTPRRIAVRYLDLDLRRPSREHRALRRLRAKEPTYAPTGRAVGRCPCGGIFTASGRLDEWPKCDTCGADHKDCTDGR